MCTTAVPSNANQNAVLSLSSSKAMGGDNIPIRIIKDGIAASLGVEYSKTNYRPIAVLVAFNNVFEPILANQVYSYFSRKLSPFYLLIASTIAVRLLCFAYWKSSDMAWTSDILHPLLELIYLGI